MNIGGAIKALRKQKGIGQNDLCDMAGITQSYLSQVEAGKKKNVSDDFLLGIAKALKISVAVIYVTAIEEDDIYNNDPGDKNVLFALETGKALLLQAL